MHLTQLLLLYLLTIQCVKYELKAVLKGVLMLHSTYFKKKNEFIESQAIKMIV